MTQHTLRTDRLLLATLAGWLVFLPVDFLGHGVLLASYWRETAEYWRPPADLFRLIPVGYLAFAVYCAALAWLLARLYGSGVSVAAGLRFGAVAGAVYWGSLTLAVYSGMRMPESALVVWTGWGTLESALAGAASAWVLAAERPGRRVAWSFLIALGIFVLGVVAQNLWFPTPQLSR